MTKRRACVVLERPPAKKPVRIPGGKGFASKAARYDWVAREVFLPLFPVIARDVISFCGKRDGRCLDLGSGGGLFGYHIARESEMSVCFLDIDPHAVDICHRRGVEWNLAHRCTYVVADVVDMPFPDAEFDVVVSRSSWRFWGEMGRLRHAFAEIHRVLVPGGIALIGSSLGTPDIQDRIRARMKEIEPEWPRNVDKKKNSCTYAKMCDVLNGIGIRTRVEESDRGTWLLIRKEAENLE